MSSYSDNKKIKLLLHIDYFWLISFEKCTQKNVFVTTWSIAWGQHQSNSVWLNTVSVVVQNLIDFYWNIERHGTKIIYHSFNFFLSRPDNWPVSIKYPINRKCWQKKKSYHKYKFLLTTTPKFSNQHSNDGIQINVI